MDRITRNDTKHGSHAKQPTEPLHDDTVIDETPAPSDTTPFLGASSRERQATSKRRKPNFITKGVNRWCNRLLGAVSERSLADQEEEYAAHRTTRDYVWNTVGVGAWGMVFPILTVVVTQLVGVEQAGMFSLAFVTGTLLMILANYGVRTYQVSDVTEEHSFSDYQINRWITCAFMVLVGVVYCTVRGYESQMFTISLGVYLYKMVDGLADVYEGRLQQVDKLYLSGVSQAFRSVVATKTARRPKNAETDKHTAEHRPPENKNSVSLTVGQEWPSVKAEPLAAAGKAGSPVRIPPPQAALPSPHGNTAWTDRRPSSGLTTYAAKPDRTLTKSGSAAWAGPAAAASWPKAAVRPWWGGTAVCPPPLWPTPWHGDWPPREWTCCGRA